MPVERITSDTFASQLVLGINSRDATIDTRIGGVRDIFIDPLSEVLENQNDRVVYLNNLFSLKNAGKLVPDDVDDLVYNEGIVRWSGSRSMTTLTFSRTTPPTVDITVPISFPVSTTVTAATGVSVVFRTIETKTMYAASASSYYNADTGKYELEVSSASITLGISAQVGAFTVTQMRRPLAQFEEVTNTVVTSSGKSLETNTEMADRYLLHIEGSQLGSPAGLKSFLLDTISTVEDAYIVYGENTSLTREQDDAGAVDVWVKGSIPTARTYVTLYNGTATLNAVDFQPLISVSSVSSVATGLTYTEGTDYLVETGVGEYAYSKLAADGIRWISGGSHPAVGDDLVIVYTYNSLMNILTAFFKQGEYYSFGSDRLFRWAQALYLEIEATLKVRSGNPSVVLALVRNAVLTYVNALKLNDNVEEFDVDILVGKIYGVDNWTWTTLAVTDGTGVSDIEVSPKNYAQLLEADFVINLS